jgi:hypothetical protein
LTKTDSSESGQHPHPHLHAPWHLARRMVRSGLALLPLGGVTLFFGMSIYHGVEHESWSEAFLNAAMLLGGMGQVSPNHTVAGRWLAGVYALIAGVVFLVVAGAMLTPVVHHVMQHLGLDSQRKRAS